LGVFKEQLFNSLLDNNNIKNSTRSDLIGVYICSIRRVNVTRPALRKAANNEGSTNSGAA